MEYELPTNFDLIIVGTGVIESILSAAASRVGKSVLHIDSNNYYGGFWASFNLDSFQKLTSTKETKHENKSSDLLNKDEQVYTIGNEYFNLKNFEIKWHIPEDTVQENEQEDTTLLSEGDNIKKEEAKSWTQTSLLKESRKFNIDLVPKLQFARGDFVELLISSNIARYSEYRSVSRVLTWLSNQLETVPCSRSDVFANNKVTVIEKRMLMKLLMALDNGDQEYVTYEKKTFRNFLTDKKLTSNLIHYVLYAISMSTDDTSCLEGIANTKRFLNSLGRFGKTPFLFSMYGSGEITQAFCRLSAVFGGIYALNQPLSNLIFEENKFKGIICGKQRISADKLIMGVEKAPIDFIKSTVTSYIARAIFITDKSIMNSEKEHLTLLIYPPEHGKKSCIILELGTLTGTCPKDLYLVHIISKQIESPQKDFEHVVQNLFGNSDEKPNILWSCYFSIPDSNNIDLQSGVPSNVTLCPGPDLDLDYDKAVMKAKTIFNELYPETEFLPRAPDPEDIIIEGEITEETTNSDEVVLKPEAVNEE